MYVVLWNDRHAEPTVHLFSDMYEAVAWARKAVHSVCYCREDVVERNCDGVDTIYHCSYSCENDHIIVFRCEIDKEIE